MRVRAAWSLFAGTFLLSSALACRESRFVGASERPRAPLEEGQCEEGSRLERCLAIEECSLEERPRPQRRWSEHCLPWSGLLRSQQTTQEEPDGPPATRLPG